MADLRQQLTDLLGGRPGWRLEPSSTPGVAPSWCYGEGGEIEFTVAGGPGALRLYVMATDEELTFADGLALSAWLQEHREDALRPAVVREKGTRRWRSMFRWE